MCGTHHGVCCVCMGEGKEGVSLLRMCFDRHGIDGGIPLETCMLPFPREAGACIGGSVQETSFVSVTLVCPGASAQKRASGFRKNTQQQRAGTPTRDLVCARVLPTSDRHISDSELKEPKFRIKRLQRQPIRFQVGVSMFHETQLQNHNSSVDSYRNFSIAK